MSPKTEAEILDALEIRLNIDRHFVPGVGVTSIWDPLSNRYMPKSEWESCWGKYTPDLYRQMAMALKEAKLAHHKVFLTWYWHADGLKFREEWRRGSKTRVAQITADPEWGEVCP